MWLKIIVVILFIANVIAMAAALRSLLTEQKESTGKTARFLTIRVVLAVLLISVVGIGLWTGQLGASAPWLSY
jgi:hypothetical protein